MLVRHVTTILLADVQRIRCFVWGLTLFLCMNTQSLDVASISFNEVSNYAWTMKKMHCEATQGNNKRFYKGSFSGS